MYDIVTTFLQNTLGSNDGSLAYDLIDKSLTVLLALLPYILAGSLVLFFVRWLWRS